MANKYERQVELAVSPDEALHRLYTAFGAIKGAGPARVHGAWVTANVGTSMASWGETVEGVVQPGPDRCLLTVRSKSAFALVDWGKNKKNVEAVITALNQQPPAR